MMFGEPSTISKGVQIGLAQSAYPSPKLQLCRVLTSQQNWQRQQGSTAYLIDL